MKATITDVNILKAISPTSLVGVLRSYGWSPTTKVVQGRAEWTKPGPAEPGYVYCPQTNVAGDYPLRVYELLEDLAIAEGTSQLQLLRDIRSSGADVVRFRVLVDSAQDGTLPLRDGPMLLTGAREAMLAAACAVVAKKPYYAARKPKTAEEYLERLRLGQSEVGSYVLTVESAVAPAPADLFPGEMPPPFERQATESLWRALDAATTMVGSYSMAAVDEAVKKGVSANLLKALASMAGVHGKNGLEVAIGWAAVRPPSITGTRRFGFSSDQLAVLGDASTSLKARAQLDDVDVTGVVVALKRHGEPNTPGEVTIKGLVDDEPAAVRLTLQPPEYSLAVEAHEKRSTVNVTGEVRRRGNILELVNPRGFTVEAPSAVEDDL